MAEFAHCPNLLLAQVFRRIISFPEFVAKHLGQLIICLPMNSIMNALLTLAALVTQILVLVFFASMLWLYYTWLPELWVYPGDMTPELYQA
jgi:hypothetical protein